MSAGFVIAPLARHLQAQATQDVRAALIGRLAVDRRYQGRQLAALLFDAHRSRDPRRAAVFALVVDAKDDAAVLPASWV